MEPGPKTDDKRQKKYMIRISRMCLVAGEKQLDARQPEPASILVSAMYWARMKQPVLVVVAAQPAAPGHQTKRPGPTTRKKAPKTVNRVKGY